MDNTEQQSPKFAVASQPLPSLNKYWDSEAEYANSDPGFVASLGATGARLLYGIGSSAIRSYYGVGADPSWKTDNASELPKLLSGIPFEYHDGVLDAQSLYDAQVTRDEILFKMRASQRVADAGALGVAASLGVGAAEFAPLMLLSGGSAGAVFAGGGRLTQSIFNAGRVAAAADRAEAAAAMASTISRARLFAYGAGHGALTGVAYTALASTVDPTVDGHDFMQAGLMGAALGGAANSLFGRGIIKNELVSMGLRYEDRLTMAGKELAVRFGADNIVDQVATRFGVPKEDARAFLVGARSLTDPARAGSTVFEDVAVAGPKARLRAGQTVIDEVSMADGRVKVQRLNDGRTVLRSLQQADNVDGFVRGITDVLVRSAVSDGNEALSNEDVLTLHDVIAGKPVRGRYTMELTPAVEQAAAEQKPPTAIPEGAKPWEVRLGDRFKQATGSAVPWSPETTAARAVATEARTNLQNAIARVRQVMHESEFFASEADTFENFVKLAKHRDGMEAIAELKRAAKAHKDAEAAVRLNTEKDLRSSLSAKAAEAKSELDSAGADVKRLNKEYGPQLRAAAKNKEAVNAEARKNLEIAARRETQAAKKVADAEALLGDLDAEYMIRRRKTPLTSAEADRFASTFLGWMKRTGGEGINPALTHVFEKMKTMLLNIYADSTDPLLGAVAPKPELDVFFRDLFRKNIDFKLRALERQGQSTLFGRLQSIARGVKVGEAVPEGPPVPGSLSASWGDVPTVNPKVLGIPMGWAARWLNQSIAAQNSENGAIRWLGNRLFWARIAPVDEAGNFVPQRASIYEETFRLKMTMENRLARAYGQAELEFLHGESDPSKISPANRARAGWMHERRAQFNSEVHAEILNPGTSINPAVKKMADAVRDHFDKMRQMAEEVGLPGFVGLEQNGSYFPRFWSWEVIDELTKTEAGTKDLAKMIRESISIPIARNKRDPAFIAGEAITADGRDMLALKVASRLRELARGVNKGAYTDMDEVMLQVLMEEAPAPVRGKGPYMSPRGRRRLPMDISRRVELSDGRTMSISDLVNTDVMQSVSAYDRSVFGAMGEKTLVDEFRQQLIARGKLTETEADKLKTWNDVREYLKSKEMRYGSTGAEVDRSIAHLDELMAGLRSEPAPMTLGSYFSPYIGRLMKLAYLRQGHAFGLAAVNEAGRIVGRTSVSSVISQLDTVRELTIAARNGKFSPDQQALLMWIDQTLGTGSDRLRRSVLGIVDSRLTRYDPTTRQNWFNRLNNWIKTKLDPNLNQATVMMSDVTGLAPITSATQMLMTTSLIQEVFDAAKKGEVPYSDALLAQWGVTRSEFMAFSRKLSETAKTNANGRVIDFDHTLWGAKEYGDFLLFLERGTISSIQDPPVRGDFSKGFWSDWGRLLLQFRTFNIKGISNFLMTSSQRADSRVAAEYLTLGALAVLTQMARKALFAPTNRSEKEQKKYYEESFSPQALVGYFMSGPTENYVLTAGVDSVAQLMTGKTVFSQNVRYSGLGGSPFDISSTPAWSVLSDTGKALRGPVQAILREDRNFSQKDLHNLTSMMFFRRLWPVSQVINAAENGISSHLNLPEKSEVKTPH